MELWDLLGTHHQEIVDTWVYCLLNDRSSRYADEREEDLRPLVDRAARAFRLALGRRDWTGLDSFINTIARKRLAQGFKLSEVQRSFMVYTQTLTPILIANVDPAALVQVLVDLNHWSARAIAEFSEYFQGLHEQFIRNQAVFLETEVTKRTKELAESEQKYKNLVEDIRDGYFVLVEGAVVFANAAFCSMHGCSPEEVLGASYLDFVAPESRPEVQQAYERSRANPQAPSRVEYLRLHRDGRRSPTEIMAKVSTYAGSLANLGVCRDISERAELERKTREAEKLNALAQLAASLAHDIRNPLTAIKMNVQLLSEGAGANPTHRRLLETSRKEVESIERSVVEMMDLARPFRLSREPVALAPFLSSCLETLAQRMRFKGVRASLRPSPGLRELRIDRHRMEQALVNVLFNAVEALPEGGRIFLGTRFVRQGNREWAEFRVSDDGPGIPKELLPYVFDSQKSRGIGLGLANVKKIVEAHGGRVMVTQRKPRGVNVRLRLPLEA